MHRAAPTQPDHLLSPGSMPSAPKPKATAIIYHFFAHYRAGVLKKLLASGHPFLLVGARKDPEGLIKEWDIPSEVPFVEARGRVFRRHILLQWGAIRQALRRDVGSVIYLGDAGYITTWISALLARFSGKRVLFWTHGYTRRDAGLRRILRKAFYSLAHDILLYGHLGKILAIEQGFDPDHLHVIYNSLDYDAQELVRDAIRPERIARCRAELFGGSDRPVAVCTTRLIAVRRLDLLIDAAALLKAQGHEINVLLVGDGPERNKLEQQAAAAGVRVCFFGECYDEQILSQLLMAADVTVAPGKVGLTAMHSLAFGTPVITHDTWDDQMPEWESIIPGKTGGFFRRNDVASLAEAIREWTCPQVDREAVRRQCIGIVERFYNPTHQARCILRALRQYPADDLFWASERPVREVLPPERVMVISNGVTPYGLHFLRRCARELEWCRLQTVYSYQYSMGQWDLELPPEIRATVLGDSLFYAVPRSLPAIVRDIRIGWRLIQQIRARKPAAVMILGYSSVSHVMAIWWCRLNKIPCLMWADSNVRGDRVRGFVRLLKRAFLRMLVPGLRGVLVCGSLGRQYYQNYGARPQRIHYVPNEPDYTLIDAVGPALLDEVAERYGIDRWRKRIIYSGRLVEAKRVELLIKAFAAVAPQRPDWDLLIVGNGPLRVQLGNAVPHELSSRVIWPGFLGDQRYVSAMYRLSEVLVLPSDYEPWALVVNEAACAGLALVCSDQVGAAAELLRDGENGRLFPAGDLQALISALLDVTDERNLRRYQQQSPQILQNWRATTDPVRGFEAALRDCLGHVEEGTAYAERP